MRPGRSLAAGARQCAKSCSGQGPRSRLVSRSSRDHGVPGFDFVWRRVGRDHAYAGIVAKKFREFRQLVEKACRQNQGRAGFETTFVSG